MSNALTLRITLDHELLATFRARWGATTSSALAYAADAIDAFKRLQGHEIVATGDRKGVLVLAVQMCKACGGMISEEEKDYVKATGNGHIRDLFDRTASYGEGVIHISQNGMQRSEDNSCGYCSLDLTNEAVDNGCVFSYEPSEKDLFLEDYEWLENPQLGVLEDGFNVCNFSFSDIQKAAEIYQKFSVGKYAGVTLSDGTIVAWQNE